MAAQSGAVSPPTELQRWMSAKGLKDWQVAEQLGLSRTQVSRIRRGIASASFKTAKRLEQLTRRHYWKFRRGSGGIMQSDETSSPQRFSRSKQATPGTSPLKRDAGDSSEASDSQPDVVRALNRNTVAVEMLAQAIQKMSERLGHAPRTGISLDKSRTSRGRNDDELLSMNEVRTMVGGAEKPISKTLVRQLIRERKLPDPVRIGPKTFRWRKKAVEAAIQEASESDI